jgi:hypothetical protein
MAESSQRLEIASRLKQQLELAYAAHLAASARWDLLAKEIPSGLPHPDGSLRIHQAGIEARAALQEYMVALRRFSDFTISWKIPDDLRPTE